MVEELSELSVEFIESHKRSNCLRLLVDVVSRKVYFVADSSTHFRTATEMLVANYGMPNYVLNDYCESTLHCWIHLLTNLVSVLPVFLPNSVECSQLVIGKSSLEDKIGHSAEQLETARTIFLELLEKSGRVPVRTISYFNNGRRIHPASISG
ncbi:hypothetical protein HY486_01445 [Candidatus Woesearchaeota archaeon]|nr:hypothetical protein [Candidatus Woesearchaeota archaeon]